MNKNEKMYDAITNIRDDIIEKAGEYKFEKKKRSFAWIGYAAAACLVLGATVFGITRLAKKPMNTHEAAVPTEQTASVPTEDTRRIVTGKNSASDNQDAVVGQRLIEYSLEDAIKAPENDGCLFDVELWISNFAEVDAYIEEQWANVLDKQNDPAILHYNEEYEYWLENIYEPTQDDIKAQENGKGREAEYFAAYWAENYPQETQDAYSAAMDAAREARAAYDANTGVEALKSMKEAAMAKLLSELADKGYVLEQGETLNNVIYKANGLLTRSQIENFPVENCGVFILWNGYEGGMDD